MSPRLPSTANSSIQEPGCISASSPTKAGIRPLVESFHPFSPLSYRGLVATRRRALSSVNESVGQRQRTEAIFHEVLAADEGRRPTLMEQLCCDDTALMEEVRSLIEASEAEERLSARLSETRIDADQVGAAR